MEGENRSKIIQNLDFIATNVCCLPRLLNLLLQESVLTQLEVDTIECLQPKYKAGTELANVLCRKDNKAFPVFISCLYETGNEAIAAKLMTETKPKGMSQGDQIWFGVTAPNIFYSGREKEMELLEKYWDDCMTSKTLSIVSVTGLGGVGKSEMAKNFAKWFYLSVGGHCIWIDAETNQLMEQSFTNLAVNSKISLINNLGKEKKVQEIMEEIYQKLFGEKLLLVFDNLENFEEFAKKILKPLIDLSSKKPPSVLRPFVITTSTLREAKRYFETHCNILDLQVLTKESAIQFFFKSLNLNEPLEENLKELIEKLCQRLHFYPLALNQALAYITEKTPSSDTLSESLEIYLEEMEKISKSLLNYELPQYDALASSSKTTLLTWRITFDKLRELSEGLAVDIMNIISFLSPDNIPAHLVIKILQKTTFISNVENVEIVFELIRKYSIINYSGMKIKVISVHRLVQEVTRIGLAERGEFQSTLSGIVRCMIAMLGKEEISLKELVHVQMVWQHLRESKEKTMIEEHGKLLVRICSKLKKSVKYRDLLDFSSKTADFLESMLGEDSQLTLRIKYWKGAALRKLGEYSQSMEQLKYVYEKQRTFGEEHEDCLSTARMLGIMYLRLKKYEEAMQINEDAMGNRERIYGKGHKKTLYVKSNIARGFRARNKLDEALRIYEEILEVREQLLGVKHPDTVTTKHNIAGVKFKQKNYQEALKEFQEVLEIQERVLESHHPETLKTKSFIAEILYELGRHQESLQVCKDVHEHLVEILGPRHPRTISTEKLIQKVEAAIANLSVRDSKPIQKDADQ